MKKQVWQIVFEFLSIVFAVLLALGLNSYKENVDLKNESEVLIEKIIQECIRNADKLDTVIVQNEVFMTYLDSLREEPTLKSFSFNFNSDLLSASAWKFTQASQSFQLMDAEFLNDVTELYEVQNYYMTISNQMFQNLGDMLMKVDRAEPKTMVVTAHYYLSNILNTASQLQTTYEDFLAKYNKD